MKIGLKMVVFTLSMLPVLCSLAQAQTATAVSALDLKKFDGQWFEIEQLPTKADRKCTANSYSLFARSEKDRQYMQVRSCTIKPGENRVINFVGQQDKAGDGKLRITRLLFLHRARWVLAMAPDGKWALMGNPNHKELWILSRTPKIAPEVLSTITAQASAQGFDISKLRAVTQQDAAARSRSVAPGTGQ